MSPLKLGFFVFYWGFVEIQARNANWIKRSRTLCSVILTQWVERISEATLIMTAISYDITYKSSTTTCPLTRFFWQLSYVIYLKLTSLSDR